MLQGAPTRKRSAEFDDSAMINVHMHSKEPISGKPWHPLQSMLPHLSWKINL
ncbi:hypothetical protein BDA96_07G087500 [Sorghum bicolor]|uniref:Uncharacterized protein n=1 Tax=Sorghum bicolor TaxID=4558 RepID=A0A921U984_SORBI|nr:hypothetical protein BDA96_07G087500 [Sorghum bicolor]